MVPEDWLDPLYDAESMRAIDSWAIEEQGVPSLELMEAAGAGVADAVRDVARPGPIRIVCGKGNNGGDGLVAARALAETGYDVEPLLLYEPGELSSDAGTNLSRLAVPHRVAARAEIGEALAGSGAVVDAIFGTGFGGAPRAPADAAIAAINGCGAPVVAADIASGVNASTGEAEGAAAQATVTVSFHAAKLGHFVAPGKWFTGELRVQQIGIPAGAPAEAGGGVIGDKVLELAPRRGPRSTKFSSGQVVIVGGSRGLTGAPCMSSLAAIRAGAGYATVVVPADLEHIVEVKLTEVMSRGCPGPPGRLGAESEQAVMQAVEGAACVVLGPGLGRDEETLALVRSIAPRIEAPLVIDADGLNALAGRLELLEGRQTATILTPHAGELARLLERSSDEVTAHRLSSAREGAGRGSAIVVLKGDDTLIHDGRRVAVNGLSAPALATAGTGDVLGGVIAALVARGMEPFPAACAGVLAHARAGRAAAGRVGAESVIASDVVEAIPLGLVNR